MLYREPEYCPWCHKPLEAIHQNMGANFVGDTFVSYKECDCSHAGEAKPDIGSATFEEETNAEIAAVKYLELLGSVRDEEFVQVTRSVLWDGKKFSFIAGAKWQASLKEPPP